MSGFKNKILQTALFIIAVGYCAIETMGKGDLLIFMTAAGDLGNHADIYTKSYMDGFHYYYSVLFAIFLKLFYHSPYYVTKFCWLLLNMFLYINLFQLLYRSDFIRSLTEKQRTLFISLLFIFSFRFLHENIHVSQISILILWCCIAGLYLVHQGKTLSGSAILALGINIKLLPLVFLPYLLYRGYFKAFICTVLFCALALILPSLIIGHDYNLLLLKSWFSLINPTNQHHVLDVDERSFHGLSTLLSTLLVKEVPDLYALEIKRNIADISLSTLSAILLFTRLALVSFTLFFLRSKPFRAAKSAWAQLIEISYVLLLIPLIFPHQQHYAFIFIAPAFGIILYYLVVNYSQLKKTERTLITSLLILIYLVCNLKILLGEFNHYYEHFKILTYGALLLIPLLIWVSRHKTLNT